MPRAGICGLLSVILLSWLEAGAFRELPWLLGILGALTLFVALGETRPRCSRRGFILLPFGLWLGFVAVSAWNVSHVSGSRSGDVPSLETVATIDAAVPVDHHEWLPSTTHRSRTLRYGAAIAGAMCLGIALAMAPWSRKGIRRWMTLLFANVVALSLVGTWFFFLAPDRLLGSLPAESTHPFATFHYKNCWAAFALLGLAAGIAVAFSLREKNLPWSKSPALPIFSFAALPPMTFLLCRSRAGLLLTVLLAGCLAAWVIRFRLRRDQALSAVPVLGAIGWLAIAGWFTVSIGASQWRLIQEQSASQIQAQARGDEPNARLLLMRDTLKMAWAKPWYGWGLASFSQVFPIFQGRELYERLDLPDDEFVWRPRYYEFAHSDWLQAWAELGGVGCVLLAGAPALWAWHCLKHGQANALSQWLTIGLGLVLLLATFEFPFGSEAVMAAFASLFALNGKSRLRDRRGRRAAEVPGVARQITEASL